MPVMARRGAVCQQNYAKINFMRFGQGSSFIKTQNFIQAFTEDLLSRYPSLRQYESEDKAMQQLLVGQTR